MSDQTTLRITPKRLGQIETAKFCPSCFWYLLKQKFKPPYGMFGGAIFNNMERAQMAVVGHLLDTKKKLPKEFAPFCDIESRVDFPRTWQKFKHVHKSGVELYGIPDDIFYLADGSIAMIDHKTAQPKGTADPLLPVYEIQLIGYSYIAEFGLDLGKVSKGGLFYWGAQHESVISDPGKFYSNGQISMPFAISPYPVDIDYSRLEAPIETAMEIWEATTPPEGAEKCKDCKALQALLAIEAEVERHQSFSDQVLLARAGHSDWARQYVAKRMYDRKAARSSGLQGLLAEADEISFANDGMVSAWEMFGDGGF